MSTARRTTNTETSFHNNTNNSAATNDAIVRLVKSLQRSSSADEEASAIDLANRILESQLGGGGSSFEGMDTTAVSANNPYVFSPTWTRRVESSHLCRSSQPRQQQQQFQTDLEQLYEELTHVCHQNSSSSGRSNPNDGLPAKLMTVLTKCIGNTIQNTNPVQSFGTMAAAGQSRLGSTQNQPAKKHPPKSTNNTTTTTRNDPMKVEEPSFLSHHHQKMKKAAHQPPSNAMQYEEQQVLRELLYALQGIDGERIKFYTPDDDDDTQQPQQDEAKHEYQGIRVLSPALQGAHKFYSLRQQNDNESPYYSSSRLGSGAMDALRICGEAGWLVRRLQHYVDTHLGAVAAAAATNSGGGGQVARALARAVAQELQAYHDCLAQWEEHLSTWSLRQWLVQIQRHPILQRLSILAMLTEALPSQPSSGIGVGGGTLLSALHAHSLHGDSRHKDLVQSVLYPTSQPWFYMLYLWTTQGLLPASWGGDFFVTLQQTTPIVPSNNTGSLNNRKEDQKHLWHDKYTLDKPQIPHSGIFEPNLVRPAFVIGKGINFIRSCLNQVGWTLKLQEENNDPQSSKTGEQKAEESEDAIMQRLGYHYVAEPQGMHLNPTLTKTLLKAEKLVHSHILQSLRKDHNLFEHLFALKQFLFHGQGDFFSSLLEGLYSEFGCGTKSSQTTNANTSFVTGHAVAGVYPQQLLSIMETALRQTNAKDLPVFCLERLRVEMLPFEPKRGSGLDLFSSPSQSLLDIHHENDMTQEEEEDKRSVWEIFQLDYTVPDPLVAIVHEKALGQYKLVYSFLFGLRKVEYMLNRTWRQSATLQHALQMMAQNNGLQTSSSVGYAHATVLLRKISMTRQAMTHFCVNLKSYCMLEVLEGGWKELLERLEHARTLDEAIQAHDYYLESICRKTLLLSKARRNRNGRSTGGGIDGKFRHLFSTILSVSTEFCALQERLFDDALEAAERVAQRRREAERRMTHGQWGFENEEELREEENFFGLAESGELAEVVSLSESFYQCMQNFLEALDAKVNGRSRNMSTTDVDEDFEVENGNNIYPSAAGEEEDVDSLRFLIHQLDSNHYYGLLQH